LCSGKSVGGFELEIYVEKFERSLYICEGLRLGNCNRNQSSRFEGTILLPFSRSNFYCNVFMDQSVEISVWLNIPRGGGSENQEVFVLLRRTGVLGTLLKVSLSERSIPRLHNRLVLTLATSEIVRNCTWLYIFCMLCLLLRFSSALVKW
jgi:hypothetical protein